MQNKAAGVFLVAILAGTMLAGCSSDKKKPLTGERISVLQYQDTTRADDNASGVAMELPSGVENAGWEQSGGNATHTPENLVLNNKELKRVWSRNIGQGSEDDTKLITTPVVGDNVVFTSNTDGEVSAFSLKDGDRLWEVNVLPEDASSTVSPGLGYGNGMLYVTDGIGNLLCLDPKTGKKNWSQTLEQPVRGAPTIQDGRIYLITLSDETLALDASNGSLLWRHAGVQESAGLLGAPSPAAEGSVVISTYSSGDVVALRAETGQEAWSDNLTGATEFQSRAVTQLSGFRGDPVLSQDVTFVGNSASRFVAVHVPSGDRVWQKEFGIVGTPLVAGNMVFAVTSDNNLVGLMRDTGDVRWTKSLPRYEDPKDKEDLIFWNGPVMGNGHLFIVGSNEEMLEIDADTGKQIRKIELSDRVMLPPVIAQKTLIIVTDDGEMVAYR